MTVESATYISDLNSTYPAATDAKSEGDDHIRLIKSTVKATFPNVNAAVTSSDEELNLLDGKVGLGYTLKGITTYSTGSGTYSVPTGVKALYVECYGGGGGAGGVDGRGTGTAGASGGGGGGGYCAKLITGTLEASYSYAVGAGGAGGVAGDNDGSAGGNTTFSGGSISLSAGGGAAGTGVTAAASAGGIPGAGGASSGGDLNLTGGTGPYAKVSGGDFMSLSLGARAAGPAAGQEVTFRYHNTGFTGNAPGGGGGPVHVDYSVTTDYAGGAGGAGMVRISEYY